MTRLVARAVLWLALTGVVVVSGSHTVYYLLGWEWNRASISATGFVAALVMSCTLLLFERLRRVEAKVDKLLSARAATTHSGGTDPTAGGEAEANGELRPDFPWLSQTTLPAVGLVALLPVDPPDRAVFIPVFLAAGLIISAMAAGVERLAGFLELRRSPKPHLATEGLAPLREQRWWVLAAVTTAAVFVIALSVGGLYRVSHYGSQPIGPGLTTMTVEVQSKGPPTTPSEVVETVGRHCAMDTGVGIEFSGVAPGPQDSTLLRVEPLLDEDARDRYIGCLQDAVLEWHRLSVTRTTLTPQ